ALIALGLAYLAALGSADRDRRDLALFRARGAGRRELIGLTAIESVALGLLAGLLGAGIAILATSALISGGVDLTPARAAINAVVCVAVAIGGAMAARLAATASVWRASVVAGRRSGAGAAGPRRPLDERRELRPHERSPPRPLDQPRPARRRSPARVRREPRHLRGDLRPAGPCRRAADARRRRGGERASG